MVALVQKEIIIIIIIIPEILFNTEYIAFSVFPFICPFLPMQNYILFNFEPNSVQFAFPRRQRPLVLREADPKSISTTDLPDPTDNWVHKNNGQYRGEYQIELIYQ